MILQQPSSSSTFSPILSSLCPCNNELATFPLSRRRRKRLIANFGYRKFRRKCTVRFCALPTDSSNRNWNGDFGNSARRSARSFVLRRVSNELEGESVNDRESQESPVQLGSNFTGFQEDPIVDKLRTQLGVIHPIPSPPINRNVVGLFVFFFFVGVVFDKLWTSRRRNKVNSEDRLRGVWPQVPTSFSLFLEKDLQRKESVEWVNMVLGKLWKVYRGGIENWIIGLLQPVIDNLKKPDYVQRVEIKQFSLGDEPLSVRNVERRTSRRVNDLQYQIGLRYTGGARMLLMLSLKFGIIPIVVPVGVRDFDIDGELWVKLRLIPTEPWVGAVSWAFVSLPKIKFELSPFRLFNLMAIPVLSMFLTKLLTEDLPRLFVRPKKIVLDFQKGKAVGPVADDVKSGAMQEGNKDSVGELSVTLVDARKLSYIFYGKTDPYVILSVGNQVIRSKKNSQTTVIGPPGMPIWNQDFHMLVSNPKKQKLFIQVKDALGFVDLTIGTGEVDLGSLKDTVPTDRIVVLQGGWGVLGKRSSGEILLRLTYKAYVEDEEDDKTVLDSIYTDASDDELSDSEANVTNEKDERETVYETDKESFMDVLAALIVSEEFQGIVASETGFSKVLDNGSSTGSKVSKSPVPNAESIPSGLDNSDGSGGSGLFWLAVITSISLLIALNIGGSSLFNP
ncbi:tricalbin-3 [Abrus precatorius]|uniref:Tricalbin-3 n=1 Tax=Abrus precatorius TaxID=3816 RepID=A0A8B8LG25_ABRPR|nr:tricalbin-3 [Abrus precatorius]XP_027354264.1 tricalbin-3 [Abrus precatorius]